MKKFAKLLLALICICSTVTTSYGVVNGIFLGSDQNGVNIINTTLLPNSVYHFPVLVGIGDIAPTQATVQDLEKELLNLRIDDDSTGIYSASFVVQDNLVYLKLETSAGNNLDTITNTIGISYKNANQVNLAIAPQIKIGYQQVSQSEIDALEKLDYVSVSANAPLISKAQFQQIADINQDHPSTFAGNNWRYEVTLTNMSKSDLSHDQYPNIELVRDFPESNMVFYNFTGNPDFTNTGTLILDVASIENANNEYYLYRSAYGNLYPLKYTLDAGNMEILFPTTKLTHYVISDTPLTEDIENDENLTNLSSVTQRQNYDQLPIVTEVSAINNYNPLTGNKNQPAQMTVAIVSIAGLAISLYRRFK